MSELPVKRFAGESPPTGELCDVLQVALLLATSFERALVDTCWASDALALQREVDRAAHAAGRLREWLDQEGSNGRS